MGMSNEIDQTQPELSPRDSVKNSILNFFNSFIMSRFFSALIGIFIGSGIVLKFNPEPIMLKQKIVSLENENSSLKKEILKNLLIIKNSQGEIKDSIKLP